MEVIRVRFDKYFSPDWGWRPRDHQAHLNCKPGSQNPQVLGCSIHDTESMRTNSYMRTPKGSLVLYIQLTFTSESTSPFELH